MIQESKKTFIISENEEVSSIILEKGVEVKQEKINDVPEKERIQLDKDTIFRFSCSIVNETLRLKLSEIGSFAPYIYECLLNINEITERFKMFKSCSNLEEVKNHIDRLFNDKKIKLVKEKEDSIKFKLTVYNISEITEIEIEAKRIMTTKKDDALMKLYRIEKDEIKLLKEIDKYVKSLGQDGTNILSKINEIKKKDA